MNYKVVVSSDAKTELLSIADFIEEKRSGYGMILINETEDAIIYLSKHPLAQQKISNRFRIQKIGRFKYYLVYEVAGSVVRIYKIVHGHQHPEKRNKKSKRNK